MQVSLVSIEELEQKVVSKDRRINALEAYICKLELENIELKEKVKDLRHLKVCSLARIRSLRDELNNFQTQFEDL